MNPGLTAIDLVIVALHGIGTVALGSWFARRQRNLSTYFVGDRKVSWWLVLISIVATETSTVTFLSVPGLAYNPDGGNLSFLQLAFGYVIGRILIAHGRDAADVPLTHIFGPGTLSGFRVWAEQAL